MRTLLFIGLVYLNILCNGQSQGTDSLIDVDGNRYLTVSLGSQVWMKENLKTTRYNDSTLIPRVTDRHDWIALKSGAYTWYENEKKYNSVYGALYNWYVVETRKLCPKGWHVPTDDEWNELEIYLGMNPGEAKLISYRGSSKGGKLKSAGTVQDKTGLWHTPNEGGSDEFGFSGLPGGFVYFNDGRSYGLGSYGFWWSSTESYEKESWYRLLYYHSGYMSRNVYDKGYGFSVRCIKN